MQDPVTGIGDGELALDFDAFARQLATWRLGRPYLLVLSSGLKCPRSLPCSCAMVVVCLVSCILCYRLPRRHLHHLRHHLRGRGRGPQVLWFLGGGGPSGTTSLIWRVTIPM